MKLYLSDKAPFARGGNRLCFVHPEAPERCVKVRRPDFTLADLRRSKRFPKNLRPLSAFDDNAEEDRVLRLFEKRFGDPVFSHVSRGFGFVETDFGRGLVSELIRDEDGRISRSLKQYIWENGYADDCRAAAEALCRCWEELGVPSRDLLVHNIVVQRNKEGRVRRLVVIDGLGSSDFIPFALLPSFMKRAKARRKTANFHQRIEKTIEASKTGDFPGMLGRLLHEG